MDAAADNSAVGIAPAAEISMSKEADVIVADSIVQALEAEWSPEEQKLEMDSWTDEKVSGKSTGEADYKMKRKHFRIFEVLILALALIVIVVVFSFPTVLFAFPDDSEATVENPVDGTNSSSACLQVEAYNGTVCREAITSLQVCFSGVTAPLNIPSIADQEMGELEAMMLLGGLSFLNPSPQCREAIVPFFCLSIFGLCDADDSFHTILREDCVELRDDICADQWREAMGFLDPGVLPICEELPDISDECVDPLNGTTGNDTSSGNGMVNVELFLNCSDGFFFDENMTEICIPECGEFNPRYDAVVYIEEIAVFVGFVAAIILLILAFTFLRKSLLTFPSIFLVYLCMTGIARGAVNIVEAFWNTELLCESKNYQTARANTTTFCTITAIVYTYSVWQVCVCVLLFAVILFWGVRCPSSYKRRTVLKKILHIVGLILAIVVPVIGVLVHRREGYQIDSTSPYTCASRDIDYNYYTFLLPLTVILGVAVFFQFFIFVTIFRNFVLKGPQGKRVGSITTSELKITVLIVYTTILLLFGVTSSVYADQNLEFRDEFRDFIICESMGTPSDCTFDKTVPIIAGGTITAARVMLNFIPLLILLISLNCRCCKGKAQARKKASSPHIDISDPQTQL